MYGGEQVVAPPTVQTSTNFVTFFVEIYAFVPFRQISLKLGTFSYFKAAVVADFQYLFHVKS